MLVILAIASSAICVNAEKINEKETKIDGVVYKYRMLNDKTVEIIKGEKSIPKSIEGYTVSMIADYAFSWAEEGEINDWKIPVTVTYIGEKAFAYNDTIRSIYIPESVTYIGPYAFYSCKNLREVVVPSRIRKIEEGTFANCVSLKEVKLNDELLYIEKEAFFNCTRLTKINMPADLNGIGEAAFYDCKKINQYDFSDSSSLESFVGKNSFGYFDLYNLSNAVTSDTYYENLKNRKRIEDFTIISHPNSNRIIEYSMKNGFKTIINVKKKNYKSACGLLCGYSFYFYINGKKPESIKVKNSNVLIVTDSGKVTALKKGYTKIVATDKVGTKYVLGVDVPDTPRLLKKINEKNKSINLVSVKEGKIVKLKLRGKASSIKNKYVSTSKAKIISKANSDTIKIKGVSKGTSTVIITVNGVKNLRIKVNVI